MWLLSNYSFIFRWENSGSIQYIVWGHFHCHYEVWTRDKPPWWKFRMHTAPTSCLLAAREYLCLKRQTWTTINTRERKPVGGYFLTQGKVFRLRFNMKMTHTMCLASSLSSHSIFPLKLLRKLLNMQRYRIWRYIIWRYMFCYQTYFKELRCYLSSNTCKV